MSKVRKTLCLAAALLLLCASFTGCAGTTDVPPATDTAQTAAETEPPAPTGLDIVADGKTEYTLIRPDASSDALQTGFVNFKKKLAALTGSDFKVATDWYNDKNGEAPDFSKPEILIGATNRPQSIAAIEALPGNSYTVTMADNKLVIAGSDNNLTALALKAFEEKILSDPSKCSEGKLEFDVSDSFTVTLDVPLTLDNLIKGGYDFSASGKQIIHCEAQGEYNVGQGACSDGTYVYFVLRNSNDTGCVICKYQLSDYAQVAVSKKLPLGHGSDAAYDFNNNLIVIAHGNTEGKILTLIDPETLTLVRNVSITAGAGAITHNASLDRYAIGQAGTSLHFLDGKFKLLKSYDRTKAGFDNAVADGYITQGLGSDESFLYFPMNMTGNTENVLVAYDWDGNFVTKIKVPIAIESESMFSVNGDYYMAFYKSKSGEYLYKLDFTIIYK